jgi:hypothetical protein
MPPSADDPPVYWSAAAALAQEEGMKRLLDEHIREHGQVPEELVVVLDLPADEGGPETVVLKRAFYTPQPTPRQAC